MSDYNVVKVKTIWGNGMVSVGSPYVEKALKEYKGINIEVKDQSIRIPYEELKKKSPRSKVFRDKRTGKPYRLYDFRAV